MSSKLDVVNKRLHNQGLVDSRWKSPQEVVRALGAVQAQDYYGAKWALGLRLPNCSNEDIEKAMNDGKIIRTHVLRPTWHFVLPEDVRWMLKLTAPRIERAMLPYYKKLDLDEKTLDKTRKILRNSLKGKQLIRLELRKALENEGVITKGMRFGFILMNAELTGLICSGARRGKQQTYTLLDERVPPSKAITPKNPLLELVTRYFKSHGPATVQDFVWWAWVKVADVKKALEESDLESMEIDSKTYWFSNSNFKQEHSGIHLLPNYDEYISYKDRSHYFEMPIAKESLMNHLIVQNGKIIGGWKHQIGKEPKLKLFKTLSSSQQEELSREVKRYLNFNHNKF